MILEVIPVGPMAANCYLVGCEETNQGAVIDPGGDGQRILARAEQLGLKIKYIINTHGHIDHIASNDEVKIVTGAKVLIHQLDAIMLTDAQANLSAWMGRVFTFEPADEQLQDGDIITVGNLQLKVIHTPGHTPGGICIHLDDHLWSGDTLFDGSVGRTDFPGGNHQALVEAIKTKLFLLPDNVRVYPGHGPATTIGKEKQSNPFVK